MYKIKKIKFQSITKNGEDSSKTEFTTQGTMDEDGDRQIIYFSYSSINFEITVDKNQLVLKQNDSIMTMKLEEACFNLYQTQYGYIPLDCRLTRLAKKDTGLQIRYELYNDEELLSKVYMMLTFLDL